MLEPASSKNLYLPEDREGGVPRFMGNPGDGSKRAWQLDFRCAAIRHRTGGRGIVLLSATPAKNSPLEFYNLIQYVDPGAWTRLGILDPEQFIDRYLKIEMQDVVTAKLSVESKGAVVGFQNLHELRDVIFRYGEFKTAEDVGLQLPEPRVEMVEVDMDPAQEAKYDLYVRKIEDALKSDSDSARNAILGLLARLSLVAVHAELDDGYEWKTADQVRDPSSPKFEALADRVMQNRSCGHIIFVDNVAAHAWVRDVLVERGIPADRIGILNAEVAKASIDRQRIAMEFNGDPDADVEPRYDVVIANAIAYEGIDLQTRTCAIHHLDLPWEPATLQQRNGRGVRQGNTLSAIAIYYYFARKSQDGLRFNLIQGKRGWMTQLLKSQDRDTNNPGAQMDLGPEEILLLISRDPEKTRERIQKVKEAREKEARAKVALEASKLLRAINTRFRRAERERDPLEAARLRGEAEERLKVLARTPSDVWPWAEVALTARERPLLVPLNGGPLFEGLRVGLPSAWNEANTDYIEFGRIDHKTASIAFRALGEVGWSLLEMKDPRVERIRPEHHNPTWPAQDDELRVAQSLKTKIQGTFRYSHYGWVTLAWHRAPDAWVERMWALHANTLLGGFRSMDYSAQQRIRLPVEGMHGGAVELSTPGQVSFDRLPSVLPPTLAGYRRFLELAPRSRHAFTELAAAAELWWGRSIPRDLLSRARDDASALLDPDAEETE